MDLVLYEVNRRALGNAVAAALGVKAEDASCGGLHMTWQVGAYPARPGTDIPLLLTVQHDSDDFRNVVRALLANREVPFVLMAPTEKHWRSEYEPEMSRRRARFLPLDELLFWEEKLVPAHPLSDVLSGYLDTAVPPARDLYVLEFQGKTWRVVFQGEEKTLPHNKGMDHIAVLLSQPNEYIHCLELQGVSAGAAPAAAEVSTDGSLVREDTRAPLKGKAVPVDSVSDDDGIKNIRNRMQEVQQKIEVAEELGNAEEASRCKMELNTLTNEMARILGYGTSARRGAGPTKRAQQAVSKAIRAAQEAIKGIFPAFGAHLQTALDRGDNFRYQSAKDVRWTIRK